MLIIFQRVYANLISILIIFAYKNFTTMNYLGQNIKYLRKQKGLTQEKMANKLGITRSLVGAYEEGRAEPRLQTLMNLARYFKISIDSLLNTDLGNDGQKLYEKDLEGDKLRILPVIVDKEDKELSVIVPVKASAGYTKGYGDIDYIESLPKFPMPFPELSPGRTYRLFQVEGDSMLPVPDGAYIICEYLQDWNLIRNEQPYILATKNEGIVYKRVVSNLQDGQLVLKPDNPSHKAYTINVDEVLEIWKALGYTSFELPDNGGLQNDPSLEKTVMQLKNDVEYLKSRLDDRQT